MKFLISSFKIFFLLDLLFCFNIILAFQGEVLFLKGKVFVNDKIKKNGTANLVYDKNFNLNAAYIKTTEDSKLILILNDEIEIRCNENSEISFEKDFIQILSGKFWIRKLKSANDLKLKIKDDKYTIKYGSFDIDADKKVLNIYDGIAFDSKNEIKQKINYNSEDNWINWNFNYDKIAVAVVLNNVTEKSKTENIIKTFFADKYIFSTVDILENHSEIPNSDIIVNYDERANIVIKDGATFEILYLINQDNLIKVLSDLYDYVERQYIKKIIKEGRNIVLEIMVRSGDDIYQLEKLIQKIPGIREIKKQNYYGQKVVFYVKYYGIGSDLKEYLEEKVFNKNKINVWKYFKNIVKSKIIE